jgi:hypothetical protein
LVIEWAALHRAELLEAWEQGQPGEVGTGLIVDTTRQTQKEQEP